MEDFVMKKLWKKIALGLFALTMASQAHALILIEPYGGYDFSLSGKDGIVDMDFSGWGYGLRLGLNISVIMFGVSYDKMDLDFEPNGGTKYNVDQRNFAIFAGFNPKAEGIRFWLEYMLTVENEPAEGGTKSKGDGFGIGLGYKFKPWVALNLEYRDWSVDDPYKQEGQSLFLNISLPFELF